jgi:hypothetical protein
MYLSIVSDRLFGFGCCINNLVRRRERFFECQLRRADGCGGSTLSKTHRSGLPRTVNTICLVCDKLVHGAGLLNESIRVAATPEVRTC